MNGARWVCRCRGERGGKWRKGNSVKAVDDWIVADMVEGVSEGAVRTASPCSVEKVDAAIDALASKHRRRCAGSETMYRMCAWELVLKDCGMDV